MNKIISNFRNLVNQYETLLATIEEETDKTVLCLLDDNVVTRLDNEDLVIEFDWYDEYTDSVETILACSITVTSEDIEGNMIRLITVRDDENNLYDFNELPTDAQIRIVQNIIKQKE